MSKKNSMIKEIGNKMEDLGHDMSKGIKSFTSSVEHVGEKATKDVKKASKKIFK